VKGIRTEGRRREDLVYPREILALAEAPAKGEERVWEVGGDLRLRRYQERSPKKNGERREVTSVKVRSSAHAQRVETRRFIRDCREGRKIEDDGGAPPLSTKNLSYRVATRSNRHRVDRKTREQPMK